MYFLQFRFPPGALHVVLCLGLRAPTPPLRASWFSCLLLLVLDLYRFLDTSIELLLDAVVGVAQYVVALLEFHEEPVLCHLLFKFRAAEAVVGKPYHLEDVQPRPELTCVEVFYFICFP